MTSWFERHSPGAVDQFRPEKDVVVTAALIDVVVFDEHRRGQHDIGHPRRCGHELLVHAGKQVVAREALP